MTNTIGDVSGLSILPTNIQLKIKKTMSSQNLSDSSDENPDDPAPFGNKKQKFGGPSRKSQHSADSRTKKWSGSPQFGFHSGKKQKGTFSDNETADDPYQQDGGVPFFPPGVLEKMRGHSPDSKRKSSSVSNLDLPAAKKKKAPVYSTAAEKIMAGMGFKKGGGLGKEGQGIVDPVAISTQRGRRGLGLRMPGLEPATDLEWDPSEEVVEVEESFDWIPSYENEVPSLEKMSSWMTMGPKKKEIDGETHFCDAKVLSDVLNCKSVFDQLQPDEMRRARSRSNPFESIKGVFFLNRAAMKMANMDARFDFMFTNPKTEDGYPVLGEFDLLFFADVCAGPGGFSEYVLWKKKWQAKGFGFTLRGENDFKLHDFHAGPVETFEPHYGEGGLGGDGDVFRRKNQLAFRDFVMKQTDHQGVHFMMADGGFSVDGQENIQEILSKQLYLCQFLTALNIVRTGGHFVCKLFDLFTPFSVGLVYLMYMAFKRVCIIKPNTSRPANSERYIVCQWRREETDAVRDYMDEVNQRLESLGTFSEEDVTELVPLDLMRDDQAFNEYIVRSNEELGRRQITNLTKIRMFYRDTALREDRQQDLRRRCLDAWAVPDLARTSRPSAGRPEAAFRELAADAELEALAAPAVRLDAAALRAQVRSPYDWCAVVMGVEPETRRDRCLVLGLGRKNVWRRGATESQWSKLDGLELPAGTLVLAEVVTELRGRLRQPLAQRRCAALHLIDAVRLGGVDVRRRPLAVRLAACAAFAAAVNKPSRTETMPVRCKRAYRMDEVDELLDSLKRHPVKGSHHSERLVHVVEEDENELCFFVPTGLLLLKSTKDPWMVSFSRTQQRQYWFDRRNNQSSYECPAASVAEFRHTARARLCWPWRPDGRGVAEPAPDGDELDRAQFAAHMALPPR